MKGNSSKNIKAAITAVGGFVPNDFISNQDLENSKFKLKSKLLNSF